MKEQIQKLQQKLDQTTDFMERLDLSGEIHRLKLESEGIVLTSGEIECEGCGS
jgi:hypothetical protein